MTHLELDWNGIPLIGSADVPPDARQALLLLHGFTGNRLEFTYFFVALARRLAEHGIATFRFDFPGCGESGGAFADITLAQQAAVTTFLLRELAQRHPQLGWHLCGFSMGGRAAMLAAPHSPVPLRSLSLIAPALNLREVVEAAAAQGVALADGSCDFLGMPIGQALRQELAALDPLAGVERITLPVLVISGGADAAVPADTALPLLARLPQAERLLLDAADHVFTRCSWRRELADALAGWLQRHVL
ncbi:alpha/beta hydrolase [Chitinilyticum litopenaei]|uniref:alpha/beta hydrolase n=1 Tax=Chitinilyticum litopenaei TaxID=1121276 RepID=UPI00130DF848|nr:alpha/beta fold hydrolase [Chitinilyticum litopenaei]